MRSNRGKKERLAYKRYTKSIAKKYNDTQKLRNKAKEEFKFLLELFEKDSNSELEAFKEIKNHLYATQKELTYFGYRGIMVGFIIVILTNILTTRGLPKILDMIDRVNEFTNIIEKIVSFFILLVFLMLFLLFFSLFFWQMVSPFFINERGIREQIYMNEYMIYIVEEKIEKSLENRFTN